jgi:hypothetical protein
MKLSNSLYCRGLCLVAILLLLVAEMFAPAGSGLAPFQLLIPSFFYPAGWSVAIFVLIVVSMRDRVILAGFIAACAAAGSIAALAGGGSAQDIERFSVVAGGLAPYLFILARVATNSGAERSRWIDILAVASLIHACGLVNPFFRDRTSEWLPGIVDLRIARLEEALGGQMSAVMANVFAAWPFLHRLSFAAYTFVQIPIVVVAALHWRRKGAADFSVLPAFIIASMIGYVLYWLAPAIGPKAYFGADFPLLHATPEYLMRQPLFDFDPGHARNAMPSLHITWALLIFLYTRGFDGGARVYAALYVFLVACATLGLGEHYLMDLIVASPLVLLVRALCAAGLRWANADRWRPAAAGLVMLTFWIATIRVGLVLAPPLVIALAAVTVAASFWLERALARAEDRANAAAAAPDEERTEIRAGVAAPPFGAVPSVQ